MKCTKEYTWIKESDFTEANPLVCTVLTVQRMPKDKVLQFSYAGKLRQMSIWGENWNQLIELLGADDDDWIGKKFRLLQFTNASDGKNRRRIEA